MTDGAITGRWCLGGYLVAAALAAFGAWRVDDEEIPRIAVLTAAFFVASALHVRLPVGSAHLLLNGLLGVVLGRRALLAIPVGLLFQVALFVHGGWTTLGINCCIMGIPAVFSRWLLEGLRRMPGLSHTLVRAALVGLVGGLFLVSGIFCITLLVTNGFVTLDELDPSQAIRVMHHPLTWLGAGALTAAAMLAESRFHKGAPFAMGLIVGLAAVFLTVLLNGLALILGGQEGIANLALLVFVVHMPLALLEGIIVGFIVNFLAQVKPELLGWPSSGIMP